MICNNLLYIVDSCISLKVNNIVYKEHFNEKVIKNGRIVDGDQFKQKYISFLKANNLSTFFFTQKLTVIYNELLTDSEINKIKNIFSELNYKQVNIKSDISKLPINKSSVYIISGDLHRVYYIDEYNVKKRLIIDSNVLSTLEINLLLLNRCKNKTVYLINDNHYLEKILKHLKLDYFIFNDQNYIINNYNLSSK